MVIFWPRRKKVTSEVIDSKNGACLDELALCLKAGEPGAALKLWDAVRRFVEMKARKRAACPRLPCPGR